MRSSTFLIMLLLVTIAPVPSLGGRIATIDLRSVTDEPSRLVYFQLTSGDEQQLKDLRERLLDHGAYHVNLFTPYYLACKLPESVSTAAMTRGMAVSAYEERDFAQSRSSGATPLPDWLVGAYALARSNFEPDEETRELMRDLRSLNIKTDSIGTLDPAMVERAAADRVPSDGQVVRRINQNTEFMLGDIVVNLIIPESKYHMEDWAPGEKNDAVKGVIAGMIRWQELFPHAPMNFIIRTIEDVYTYYEPSHTPFEYHENWIRDIMSLIGYNYATWEAPRIVDKFHQNVLKYYSADWVFTVFIIRSKNMPNYMMRDTDFNTYAIRGGPYIILPFPTGPYSYYIEYSLITALNMQHDMGHMFWAMDEYIYSQGFDCENRCGYLNYPNYDKVEDYILGYIPVNHCIGMVIPCIMEVPERQWSQEVCPWSAGQTGIVDWNENDVPDIFDSPPIVDFVGGPAETLVTDTFTVHCTVKSIPIPNRNYKQDTTAWIDYTCPLKDAVMDINGFGNLYLIPDDGRWDEVEEELTIPLSDLSVGETSIELYIRNTVGCKSPARVKKIFKAGLSFSLFEAVPGNEGINLSWYMVGETFGAVFDLYRIDPQDSRGDTTLVASNLQPSGPAEDQFLPFSYYDADVNPSETYWYFVRGTYTLAIQGGPPQEFVTDSKAFKADAIIPIPEGAMMSFASPNPFRASTQFSIIVPRSFSGNGSSSPATGGSGPSRGSAIKHEVPTRLDVRVYDVQGRPIKTIVQDSYFGRTLTLEWDGTNDRNERVPSGIYFLRATAGAETQVRKLAVLR